MAARGVRTLYLETGNYKQRTALVQPERLSRFIEAAHASGIEVVAWYLPSFRNVPRDLKRSLAAIEFETPTGQRFDSFALDIGKRRQVADAPNKPPPRSLRISCAPPSACGIRSARSSRHHVGSSSHCPHWPGFPYACRGHVYDVILPMAYHTYRVEGAAYPRVHRAFDRDHPDRGRRPSVPIHVIGWDRRPPGQGGSSRLHAGNRRVRASRILRLRLHGDQRTWTALQTPPAPPPNPAC